MAQVSTPDRAPSRVAAPLIGRLASSASLQALLALAVYAAGAVYFTWPLVTDLEQRIYGAGGDLTGSITIYRELVEDGLVPFLPGVMSDLNAPEGLPVRWTLNLVAWPSVGVLWLLTTAFGGVAAYGIYTLLGFLLSGQAMFLLVRRLVGNPVIAVIAGWGFAFYPFPVLNAGGHNDLAHGWPLVLMTWAMIELIQHPGWRNSVLAGLATIFAVSWTPMFILLGGVAYAALAIGGLLLAWRSRRIAATLGPLVLSGAMVLTYLAGLLVLNSLGTTSEIRTQGIEHLYTYSARPVEYLLPSGQNPLVGQWSGPYLAANLHGSNFTESTLYVGLTTILLSGVALVSAIRGRLPSKLAQMVLLMTFVALLAGLVSAPPKNDVFGYLVPFPSFFIFELTSTFRAYSRLVVVVMLAMSVLAAIGVYALVVSQRPVSRALILGALAVAVPVDLWGGLGNYTNETEPPPRIYSALQGQPRGIVAEYPLAPTVQSDSSELFFQQAHGMPILNAYPPGSPNELRASHLGELDDPTTPPRLAALGVRYVLLNEGPLPAETPAPGRPGPGFELMAREPTAALYRVTARSEGAVVSPGKGFSSTEYLDSGPSNWITGSRAELRVQGSCDPCVGRVTADVMSFFRPREVAVADSSGRILARTSAGVKPRRLDVRVRLRGNDKLVITTRPGPQSITQATGAPDPRSVSLFVTAPRFVAGR